MHHSCNKSVDRQGVYFSWGGESDTYSILFQPGSERLLVQGATLPSLRSGTGGAGGTDAVENMDASNDRFLQCPTLLKHQCSKEKGLLNLFPHIFRFGSSFFVAPT